MLPEQAAAETHFTGSLSLIGRGSAGLWLHSSVDLLSIAEAIARRSRAPVRWYEVSVEAEPLGGERVVTRAATLTPDGRRIEMRSVADDMPLDEPQADPQQIADDALGVLLEMYESIHVEDSTIERRAFP